MSKKDAYNRVFKVNEILISKGYTWNEITQFWKDCIKDSVKKEVIILHEKGLQDKTISDKLNVPKTTVGLITQKYWSEKMKNKV